VLDCFRAEVPAGIECHGDPNESAKIREFPLRQPPERISDRVAAILRFVCDD
jgi:hypothetical protein